MAMESRVPCDFLSYGLFSEKNRFTESSCIVSLEEGNVRMQQTEEGCLIH
jgi:hypothetical protein